MLTELSIKDFAIIDEISTTFHEGLTVLTGETGAGKSIIIDAIQLLAGERGSVEFVRYGAKKAELEGLFNIDWQDHPVYTIGKQYGIEIADGMIILQRTITANGKSICRVNGKLVTLAILKECGRTLIDIHSQHETQSLMDSENHIDLLDMYDHERMAKAKEEYLYLYNTLVRMKKRHKELSENDQEMAHRLDLLEFQKQELKQANLTPDEDRIIEEERNKLANFEQIYKGLQDAYNALYGEQKGIEWLYKAVQSLEAASNYNIFIAKKAEELSNHYYIMEELAIELRNYCETLEHDPERLNELEARLSEIHRLKKKYGPDVNEMIAYLGKIEEEIEQIKNKDSHLLKLEKEIEELHKDTYLEAKELHDIRKKAAKMLIQEIHHELKDLYLENTSFHVSFDSKKEAESEHTGMNVKLHPNGFDHIRFQISTNYGEPLKELSKVASGGELSRIMLALKRIFAKHQGITSVIFDEVDTGVSGRVAQAIAEKIHHISIDSQVLCITHLPQVAAMADTHKRIQKNEEESRTTTNVNELTAVQKVEELSRMIAGAVQTATAKQHAKELLDDASAYKVKLLN